MDTPGESKEDNAVILRQSAVSEDDEWLAPFKSLQELLSDDVALSNPDVVNKLCELSKSFKTVFKSEHGQTALSALQGLAGEVKTKEGLHDAVKITYRLAKRISTDTWVQFGTFIGLFGSLIAAIGINRNLEIMGEDAVKEVASSIITKTMLCSAGGNVGINIFMNSGEFLL